VISFGKWSNVFTFKEQVRWSDVKPGDVVQLYGTDDSHIMLVLSVTHNLRDFYVGYVGLMLLASDDRGAFMQERVRHLDDVVWRGVT
jgi:hypothetical protein